MDGNTIFSIILTLIIIIIIVVFSILLGVFNNKIVSKEDIDKANTSQDETIKSNASAIAELQNKPIEYFMDDKATITLFTTKSTDTEETKKIIDKQTIKCMVFGYYNKSTKQAVISSNSFLYPVSDTEKSTKDSTTIYHIGAVKFSLGNFICETKEEIKAPSKDSSISLGGYVINGKIDDKLDELLNSYKLNSFVNNDTVYGNARVLPCVPYKKAAKDDKEIYENSYVLTADGQFANLSWSNYYSFALHDIVMKIGTIKKVETKKE